MATAVEAYRDNKGNLHHDPSSAIISDIAAVLGRVGDEGGLTEGVSRLILEKRGELETAFADLDRLEGKKPTLIDVSSHPKLRSKSA